MFNEKPDASGLRAEMPSAMEGREGVTTAFEHCWLAERGDEMKEDEERRIGNEQTEPSRQEQQRRPHFKDQVRAVQDELQQQQQVAPGIIPNAHHHSSSSGGGASRMEQRAPAGASSSGPPIFAEAVAAGSEEAAVKKDDRNFTFYFSVERYKVYWALSLVLAAIVFFLIGFYAGDSKECSCDDYADPLLVQWKVEDGGNGHYYKVFQVGPEGITWLSAEAEAVAMGGHLASITSQEENEFVFFLVSDESYYSGSASLWLGGFQPDGSAEPSGGFQWSDGEPFNYTNWSSGEPNDEGGDDGYIEFYSQFLGTWNDYGGLIDAYIVEWSNVP